MMETKYGTPWLKVNFIGIESTNESLRQMAQVFGDEELARKTEEVIERETTRVGPVIDQYRKVLQGKTAFAIVGGSRSHHYQYLLRDLGMEMIVAGYEFAHRDDYEGRQVIPTIKTDADTKNIPELHLVPDEKMYKEAHVHLNMSKEKFEELKTRVPLNYYEGIYPNMKGGADHHRRRKPPRGRRVDQNGKTGPLPLGCKRQVHRPQNGRCLKTTSRIRLQRTVRRIQRRDQLRPRCRKRAHDPRMETDYPPMGERTGTTE